MSTQIVTHRRGEASDGAAWFEVRFNGRTEEVFDGSELAEAISFAQQLEQPAARAA